MASLSLLLLSFLLTFYGEWDLWIFEEKKINPLLLLILLIRKSMPY